MLVDGGRCSGVHVLAALIILAREILVSGLREFLAELRVGLPVSQLAKWKTAVQMVAIALLLVGDAGLAAASTTLGLWAIWIAAGLTLITGYDYLRTGLRHMAEDAPTGSRRMKVRYFAWMKRTVGVAEEEVDAARRGHAPWATWWPGCAHAARGHAEALAEGAAFGAAVDKRTATFDVSIAGAARGRVLPALHRRLTP